MNKAGEGRTAQKTAATCICPRKGQLEKISKEAFLSKPFVF